MEDTCFMWVMEAASEILISHYCAISFLFFGLFVQQLRSLWAVLQKGPQQTSWSAIPWHWCIWGLFLRSVYLFLGRIEKTNVVCFFTSQGAPWRKFCSQSERHKHRREKDKLLHTSSVFTLPSVFDDVSVVVSQATLIHEMEMVLILYSSWITPVSAATLTS